MRIADLKVLSAPANGRVNRHFVEVETAEGLAGYGISCSSIILMLSCSTSFPSYLQISAATVAYVHMRWGTSPRIGEPLPVVIIGCEEVCDSFGGY